MAGTDTTQQHGDGDALKRTPLHGAHKAAGARLVPFAGYEMPLQYSGIIAEHLATRKSAGLFDVSHMGQVDVTGPGAGAWLERLAPAASAALKPGSARYSVLLNPAGGVIDDLIITRLQTGFRLVVNGARKDAVAAHFAANDADEVSVKFLDRALIALQGPAAEAVLGAHTGSDLAALNFMTALEADAFGVPALISRVGYTGEDGFELSLPQDAAATVWSTLLADPRVSPVGLGARDTLRLEAGLCLYGQDLTEEISPVEAGIAFVIPKARRENGGFLGAERAMRELRDGAVRRRVGLAPQGRVPARAGAPVFQGDTQVGVVTSGGVGPSVGRPIAMGLVNAAALSGAGAALEAEVRGKRLPLDIAPLPFVPARTKRSAPTKAKGQP
ncbi:MAG: glycine cleavage system aminomethyltransferase GcvT [Pseudomonadota bacterium]